MKGSNLSGIWGKLHRRILVGGILTVVGISLWLAWRSPEKQPSNNLPFDNFKKTEKTQEVHNSPTPSYSDEDALATFKSISGEFWYGIYVGKHKVGYANHIIREVTMDGKGFCLFKKEDIFKHLKDGKETFENRITEIRFEAQPPFELHRYAVAHIVGDHLASGIVLDKKDGAYQLKRVGDMALPMTTVTIGDYTMKDHLAIETWLKKTRPAVNAITTYRHFDINTLKTDKLTAQLNVVNTRRVDDVDLSSYEVMVKEIGIKLVYNKAGMVKEVYPPGPNHYKMEAEETAKTMDPTTELADLLGNTVALCDRAIDKPENVKSLKIRIVAPAGVRFESGPGLEVQVDQGRSALDIEPGKGAWAVTSEEAAVFAGSTRRYPSDHPDVIRLAREAVGEEQSPHEQVKKLAEFVGKYVDDVPIHRDQKVIDTIVNRTGDCTEHAELFVTMARALGIPARTVGGLHYLGGLEFAGHMWCEVAIDGIWMPVDPTLDQFPIDALHIRFPTDEAQCYANMNAIKDMKIMILQVGYNE